MFEPLLAVLAGGAKLDEAQVALITSSFLPRSFERGQFFQRAGQVTSRGGFVVRGCFRTYAIGEDGTETITHFSPEHAWVGDIQSATSGEPSPFHVQALEPCEVLTIDLPSFERLLDAIPPVARSYRLGLQHSLAVRQRRTVEWRRMSAEERYLEFVERQPTLVQRVPQHMLASYLGVTPETLSRIRARMRER